MESRASQGQSSVGGCFVWLLFVGGGALVVVGGTRDANNRGWQPMGGDCGAGGWLARWYLWVW